MLHLLKFNERGHIPNGKKRAFIVTNETCLLAFIWIMLGNMTDLRTASKRPEHNRHSPRCKRQPEIRLRSQAKWPWNCHEMNTTIVMETFDWRPPKLNFWNGKKSLKGVTGNRCNAALQILPPFHTIKLKCPLQLIEEWNKTVILFITSYSL